MKERRIMNEEYIDALEAAKKYKLFLEITTSVKSFETYNSFYNIFDQGDEPCRRIVVLTKYEGLEEVYDEDPEEKIDKCKIVDGNLWIKSYSLLVNPKDIDVNNLKVPVKLIEELIK